MLRIGCLGAARITPKAVIEPTRALAGVAVTAVAARDRDRAHAFAAEHGVPAVADDYAALIDRDDVDLVYNALPLNLHATWSIRALHAGKHVLCEKPFAMSLSEAEAVLETAQPTGRRVIEAFHHRYHPTFGVFLDWLAQGRIGTVNALEATFAVPIPDRGGAEIRHRLETGGGAFRDLGCYTLAWALSAFAGEPVSVTADAVRTPAGVDETLAAQLTFAGGETARLHASMALAETPRAHLQVTGTEGAIVFANPLAPQLGSRLVLQTVAGETVAPDDRSPTYLHQLRAVIDGLTTGTPLPTEGDAILRQQRVLDRILAAAETG